MAKKLIPFFVLAFGLNWTWEILHSALYLNYRGGTITSFILFRAAIADAAMILILVFLAQKLPLNKSVFVFAAGLVLAVVIELLALKAGRWEYNALMPVIPFIKVGLTPTVQLAVIGYLAQKLVFGNNFNAARRN